MNLTLQRVVYISEATRPDPDILVLADILATSGRNNQRDGLSGALLVTPDRFLKVLEGRAQDLDRILDRLQTDSRHRDLEVLDRRTIDRRQFGQWTMVAARLTPSRAGEMDDIVQTARTDPSEAAGRVHALVRKQLRPL